MDSIRSFKYSRPVIVAGYGIRLAGEVQRFQSFVHRTRIPVVTTWTGADLLPTANILNTGILGISGQPGGNKAVHNADFLLVLGSHLSLPQTSTLVDEFAPNAKRVFINIDQDQLDNLNVRSDLSICAHLRQFFDWAEENPLEPAPEEWLEQCRQYKDLNQIKNTGLTSYTFNAQMTQMLPPETSMVIDGGGTALYTGFQSSYIKRGSRLICSTAMSAMGSGLPEAIGACLARPAEKVGEGYPLRYSLTTCLIGDGSFMMNLQELQTIVHHNLPIKICVINNGGYLAIRHTQKSFLEGRYSGTSKKDISFPDIKKIAQAFGIPYFPVCSMDDMDAVGHVLELSGPAIFEVFCPEDQSQYWKQGYRKEGERFVPQNLGEMACG